MPKHTPGPWELSQDDANRMCIDADEVLLARCVAKWDGSGHGNRYDALLMAAAPELLEACKAAMLLFDGDDSLQAHATLKSLPKQLQAAIQKAEGA
jgi:hypothetical protein